MEKNENTSDLLQLVSFNIGREEFGIDILKVQEINRMITITKFPNAPEYVEGVINLRGRVIPVVDLRTKLGMEKREADKDARIIVVELDGKTTGFKVDSVNEVLRIPANITEEPPTAAGMNSKYITAVAKLEDRLLLLLDLELVLMQSEKEELMGLAKD
ncbi:MAG: chemotaxis protein CheW [Ignavibacteriales bacterium]